MKAIIKFLGSIIILANSAAIVTSCNNNIGVYEEFISNVLLNSTANEFAALTNHKFDTHSGLVRVEKINRIRQIYEDKAMPNTYYFIVNIKYVDQMPNQQMQLHDTADFFIAINTNSFLMKFYKLSPQLKWNFPVSPYDSGGDTELINYMENNNFVNLINLIKLVTNQKQIDPGLIPISVDHAETGFSVNFQTHSLVKMTINIAWHNQHQEEDLSITGFWVSNSHTTYLPFVLK